jgi:N-methylhydantoinase A/oxoprolinase/acetone carboxylase beta subunit/N-methylhydantoinase B/oxoprolinase/acetone carboxylase alpha subunit
VWQVGIDTGGTFTDLVAIHADGRRLSAKVPSTPPNFEEGILQGLDRLGIPPADIALLYHGTTVTTNVAITKTGAKSALVTTKGFRDVLEIRRGHRQDLYDILWDPPEPLIPRYNRLELSERVNYAGEVLEPVDQEELASIARTLKQRSVEAVAVVFLHSYANAKNEQAVTDHLRKELPGVYVTASSDLLPQPPEFERTSTTVANAYLGPVLVSYLERLKSGLSSRGYHADVLLMHSGGGLMTLESAIHWAVRTAGSGPAAGVVGAAAVGTAAGRQNLISMDMGGTSCDVSVILDGRPRMTMQHNLEWGLPISFPSTDFIAIGAGGGSVAWIDSAGYPRSGPESAGAVPGPACYSRGGTSPTTTDANLVLQRLNEDTFLGGELPIDVGLGRAAIESQIASPLGLTVEDAAAGMIRIVNANMASAVRLVTVQKGFDPREFSMVGFGGAGPLHAVEVARELGIPEVIIPPEPGLTSALGLLFVELVHDALQSFVMGESVDRYAEAESIFLRFENELAGRLRAEGATLDKIRLRRQVDVRYVGQVHTITVAIGFGQFEAEIVRDAVSRFHDEHLREYRYSRPDWPVEISVLRVDARAETAKPRLKFEEPASTTTPRPVITRRIYFEGPGWVEAAIVDRNSLRPGSRVQGPAVVEEFNSTTLLPPDVSADVDASGNLVIKLAYGETDVSKMAAAKSALKIDPVTFEVLRNAFVAIVDEMGVMLEKVAFSLVVSQGRDFSTSICDARGDLVADGTQDLPAHVGTIPFSTKGVLELIGADRLAPGDVIVMNDAFIGGTHCQDVRAIMPVYYEDELVAFVQSSAHWSDAGGSVPGSFKVDATSPYEEALYITPIHLVRRGILDEDVMRFILRNVRVPEITRGDAVAMIEACRTGDERLQALFRKYGKQLLVDEMLELTRHSELMLRNHFQLLPDGTYSFTDYIDYDPGAADREPLKVHLDLTIRDGQATYDFSRSAPQAKGAVNATRSLLWSAVVVSTKAIFPDVAVNQGMFRAIDLIAQDGLVLTATYPAAVSGAFATCYEKITSCVLGCYLQILPDKAMVACGNNSNIVIGGWDPRPGFECEYVFYNWLQGGYGARPGKKDNHTAMSLFASGTQNQPIELTEMAYPVIYGSYGLMQDSAGPGRHRGGLGVVRDFALTHGEGVLSVAGDRELRPAWGYAGGGSANRGNGLVYRPGKPDEYVIGMKRSGFRVESGATIHYWQGGGGGYGPAWERPIDWVVDDLRSGYISFEGARDDYFVVMDQVDHEALEYRVDMEATQQIRSEAARSYEQRSSERGPQPNSEEKQSTVKTAVEVQGGTE